MSSFIFWLIDKLQLDKPVYMNAYYFWNIRLENKTKRVKIIEFLMFGLEESGHILSPWYEKHTFIDIYWYHHIAP